MNIQHLALLAQSHLTTLHPGELDRDTCGIYRLPSEAHQVAVLSLGRVRVLWLIDLSAVATLHYFQVTSVDGQTGVPNTAGKLTPLYPEGLLLLAALPESHNTFEEGKHRPDTWPAGVPCLCTWSAEVEAFVLPLSVSGGEEGTCCGAAMVARDGDQQQRGFRYAGGRFVLDPLRRQVPLRTSAGETLLTLDVLDAPGGVEVTLNEIPLHNLDSDTGYRLPLIRSLETLISELEGLRRDVRRMSEPQVREFIIGN